ncbi:hypothetical protein NX722_05650 [Endozoicomonas gorgoniicola]|uniref:Uncharacterized protein n=1 Tax=Endozoicomonas gorgoniicola TaxID=1234144 RepID=A0ABT3MRZ1_9GAMM|nr:hypothetical protein [Endozoicomonas gorgoniicola]MCW7552137.1 hypothetical protein [Endozoicomonas gorgoniicola]
MTEEGKACRQMIEEALGRYGLPTSESAIRLLCMIAAHESGGFTYSKQVRGPALSLFQMEPRTFRDLVTYCQRRFPNLSDELPCSPMRLIFDPGFAAAMGRAFLLRIPEPLPDFDNIDALGQYAKTYWNTRYGKATPKNYSDAWRHYFGDSP